jgi:HlyD family secretion protein
MDMKRDPAILRAKKRRQAILLGLGVVAIIGISVAVSRLEPAVPTVSAATLWPGTVKRGPMVREVRGTGTLIPEEIRWITATAAGRVERIVLQPGAEVQPGTVILELSNPDLKQNVASAELDWRTAVAQLTNQRATQATTRLQLEGAARDAQSSYGVATADLEANRTLAELGLVAALVLKQKEAALDQAKTRRDLAQRQAESAVENSEFQLAPFEAAVNQRKAEFDRLARQLADLQVRSTMSGLLQLVSVEVGQQVGPGVNLARVSDPTRLKAQIRISETQTRDLAIGQKAAIDTRSGIIPGHVTRIDPASQGGTVGVDVTLDGPLTPGARPDLNVDGTIELERLTNVLYVESPAFGQENSTISLFKIQPDGQAVRVPVKIGRRSVQFVEVVEGLQEGDRVILSDMSQYDGYDRLRLN